MFQQHLDAGPDEVQILSVSATSSRRLAGNCVALMRWRIEVSHNVCKSAQYQSHTGYSSVNLLIPFAVSFPEESRACKRPRIVRAAASEICCDRMHRTRISYRPESGVSVNGPTFRTTAAMVESFVHRNRSPLFISTGVKVMGISRKHCVI